MSHAIVLTALVFLACGCSGGQFVSTPMPDAGGSSGDAGSGGSDPQASKLTGPGQGGAAAGSDASGGGSQAGGDAAFGGGGASAAGTAGVAGNAGSAGATAACTEPRPELCDGIDNDCDGVVDNACVAELSVVFQKPLFELGDPNGGGPYLDNCPPGQLLAGIQARMGGNLTQVQGVCREPALTPNANAPLGYTLAVHEGATLPPHPDMSTDPPSTLLCGAGQVLVGLRAALQDIPFGDADGKATLITKLWISCAKLALVRVANDAIALQADGARVELAPATGSSAKADDPISSSMVPAGTLATRLFGASGLWVDRVGLGVSEVQVAK